MSLFPMKRIRLLVVDDHPVVRQGIAALLEGPDVEVVAQAADGAEAVSVFLRERPDVTLMDLRLPGLSGVEATAAIKRADPAARVVVLTTYDGDAHIQAALDAGADGYLLKDMPRETLMDAVRSAHAGRRYIPAVVARRLAEEKESVPLSPRELEVLALLARGERNQEIAATLSLATATVKLHVHSILSKLKAKDRTEAAAIALRRGLVRI